VVVPPSAGSAYGGNGAVSPTEGGSAFGGKTVVIFHRVGEVPEWLNGAVSKTVVLQGTPGSNPGLSAFFLRNPNKIICQWCRGRLFVL
jgi:hypothetical protein